MKIQPSNNWQKKISQFFATPNKSTNEIKQDNNNENQNLSWRYYCCGFFQTLGCGLRFFITSWEFLLYFLVLTYMINIYSVFSTKFFVALVTIMLGLYPALFLLAILAKWSLLGKIKPGNYPLWGTYYMRWWLVQQLQKLAPIKYIINTPFIKLYYRLNGVKLGRNCHIGSEMIRAFDLITIGDDTSISESAMLFGSTVENGWLKLGPITIGNRCYVGVHSVLGINTKMGDDAKLEDLSMLPENANIPNGETYSGSPARQSQHNNILNKKEIAKSGTIINFSFGFLQYLFLQLILLIYTLALAPGILLIDYFYYFQEKLLIAISTVPLGGLFFILILGSSIILIKKILVNDIPAGTYKVKSINYIRMWLLQLLFQESSFIDSVYGSIYFPFLSRLLGVKIGRHSEISTGIHNHPNLLTIEDECFIADWALLGTPRIERGYIHFAPVTIGKRTFVGNSALLPPGTQLGEKCLIGVLSIPPINHESSKTNTSWFGSPAFYLPKREIFSGFSEKETFLPPKKLYFYRGIIDLLRAIAPTTFAFLGLTLQFWVVNLLLMKFSLLKTILLFPLIDFCILLLIAGIAIELKWLLIGRFRETVKPNWSLFVWLDELITCLFDFVIATQLLEGLLGTPFYGFFMRLLGAKVGERVYFDTTYFTEFDLIDIGNDVCLNANSILQTHLFEDRVMKMGKIKIDNGCTIGNSAFVLYNTIMEEKSSLGSLSLLMKGEILPHDSHWGGIPAQHISQYNVSFSNSSAAEKVPSSVYVPS